jgi:hypothetical protein
MKEHWIDRLRRYPHSTTGAVLLEMAFIGKPQIKVVSCGQPSEFFYMRLSPPGPPGRSETGVCDAGTPVDGRLSDTGGRPDEHRIFPSNDDLKAYRPIASEDSLTPVALDVNPLRRLGVWAPLGRPASLSFPLPEDPQTRVPQSGGPSIEPFEDFGPKGRRYRNNLIRNRRAELRAAGGHSGILRSDGSRPGWPAS